jgi:hypothetical protein
MFPREFIPYAKSPSVNQCCSFNLCALKKIIMNIQNGVHYKICSCFLVSLFLFFVKPDRRFFFHNTNCYSGKILVRKKLLDLNLIGSRSSSEQKTRWETASAKWHKRAWFCTMGGCYQAN